MYQGIIVGSVALLITAILLIFRKKLNNKFSIVLKILAVTFFVVGFFRFMLSDAFIWVIKGGYYGETFYNKTDYLQSIIRWGYFLNYVVLPMAIFFNSRLFKNIALYFCLPFTILSIAYYGNFMNYFLSDLGRGMHFSSAFRHFYFCFELILALSIPILFAIKEKYYFNIKSKTEWYNFLVALPLIILLMIPVYVPQSLIGYTKYTTGPLTMGNFIWIGIILVVTFALYYYFRFKDYQTRYKLVVFLTLALFVHYNSTYLMGFSIPRLPIQLCNLGSYFFLVAVVFKLKRLFNFAFIANIVGAMLAILAPDTSGGLGGFWNIHFMFEHSLVLIVPAVAMALRVFPRLSKRAMLHTFVGFSCYFAFCSIAGTLLNAYSIETGFEVNYFYIFDIDKALDVFPFLRFTTALSFTVRGFNIYPFFQLTIFAGFFFLCYLFYLVLQKLYEVTDDHINLRLSRIELYEKRTGKKSKAPREFVE